MKVKDPVHGYIKIEKEITKEIVDTCEFQRLREIRQTNYHSVYPGSLHNRFTHSLGVFFLGSKTFEEFKKNVENSFPNETKNIQWDVYKNTFEFACLLHDVGHAPFSHTGEKYYKVQTLSSKKYDFNPKQEKIIALYINLLSSLQKELSMDDKEFMQTSFYKDYKWCISQSAEFFKPHEGMSVIISLNTYSNYFKTKKIDCELFSRMIIGLQYDSCNGKLNSEFVLPCDELDKEIKNSLISLLNSSILDVDKLDYLLRDTHMTGFDNMSIDIERLLSSFTIILDTDRLYRFAYEKSALSTLENVLICYDSERKWIQTHPAVQYDSFLFTKCVDILNKKYSDKIFSQETLTRQGISLKGVNLKLLSDCDILFLLKQVTNKDLEADIKFDCYENLIQEFFSRKDRKKSLWKSEAEYNLFISDFNTADKKELEKIFISVNEDANYGIPFELINDGLINFLTKQKEQHERELNNAAEEDTDKKGIIYKLESYLFWCNSFKKFCADHDMPFDIAVVSTEAFGSKLENIFTKKLSIYFEKFSKYKNITDIDNLYTLKKASETISKKFFYLYFKDSSKISIKVLTQFFHKKLEEFSNWKEEYRQKSTLN